VEGLQKNKRMKKMDFSLCLFLHLLEQFLMHLKNCFPFKKAAVKYFWLYPNTESRNNNQSNDFSMCSGKQLVILFNWNRKAPHS